MIITHSYDDRKGVRYMTGNLKIYYLPIRTFYSQCILPTMMCNIPLLRNILIREQIDIVHGHSAFSALAHEVMFVGKLLGLRVSGIFLVVGKWSKSQHTHTIQNKANINLSLFSRLFLPIIVYLALPIYLLLLPISCSKSHYQR